MQRVNDKFFQKIEIVIRVVLSAVIILALYYIGCFISSVTGNLIPGSIVGMIMLFLLLTFGVIKESWVKPTVDFLLRYMVIFFLPPSVGIMAIWGDIKGDITIITIATIISTVIVLVVVGMVQQKLGKRW